ncbi:MAG TPA: ergothioneine biosynthesis protein EgtC [Acidimicrobiia bacterium]
MCRHLVYLGARTTLEDLLLTPEHSLLRQAYAPRHQTHGADNADGFGVAWYDFERRPEPARYRTPRPMWTDQSFASIAGMIRSTAVLAAVRSASPGMPVEESGTPPFVEGRWVFSHNGIVPGFQHGVGRELRRRLSERRATGILGASDSELLFGLVLDRLDVGASPADAVSHVVRSVESVTTARLNLLLTDGKRAVATAWRNSLFVLDHRFADGTTVVASEPHDSDPAWKAVPDGSVVEVNANQTTITSL